MDPSGIIPVLASVGALLGAFAAWRKALATARKTESDARYQDAQAGMAVRSKQLVELDKLWEAIGSMRKTYEAERLSWASERDKTHQRHELERAQWDRELEECRTDRTNLRIEVTELKQRVAHLEDEERRREDTKENAA